MLGLTAALAIVFVGISAAFRNNVWALAFSAAVLALVVLLVVYGLLFFLVWMVAKASERQASTGGPFRPQSEMPVTPGLTIPDSDTASSPFATRQEPEE